MTTTTFGGGPNIEARRNFSNLKEGSQVPGYKGYIHQIKYNCGHTYGDQTHVLFDRFANVRQKTSLGFDENSSSRKPTILRNSLPKTDANGITKLTETMVPGYTGYVPSRKFKFSDTYKNECDQCIDDFLDKRREKSNKIQDILKSVHTQPKFNAIASGSDLNNKLAVKTEELFSYKKSDKRLSTEPPMPGYTGHMPKIVPTELGLGARYHATTEKGLRAFDRDYRRYKSAANLRSVSYNPEVNIRSIGGTENLEYLDIDKKNNSGKRIYIKPGMIPSYTGYIHGRRFEFGNTYGDTTRELPVCAHDYANFGDFMQTRRTKTFIC